jgi:iron complex transport system substrate-binding protein
VRDSTTLLRPWWKSRTANSCWGKKGEHSAAIASEQLRDADPEYLIVAPCGFNLQRSLREQGVLERHPWWRNLQSMRNGNVAFADGNLFFNRSGFNRSGMTVSQTAEIIAAILHGVSFSGRTEEVSWRRVESPVERSSLLIRFLAS